MTLVFQFSISGCNNPNAVQHWPTRISLDHGLTWEDSDDYTYVSGNPSIGSGITTDLSGNIYTTGQGIDSSQLGHWLVRKEECL